MELHLPWSLDEERATYQVMRNADRDPVLLVYKSGWDRQSFRLHGRFIEKAVNNHDRLVSKTKTMMEALDALYEFSGQPKGWRTSDSRQEVAALLKELED